MATKKQKHAAMLAKRALREETLRQEGLAAQLADRERREQATKNTKIETSKELHEEYERKKSAAINGTEDLHLEFSFANLTHE